MADNVTVGSATGVVVSSEEATTLNGTTVTAQQVQRTIPSKRVSDGVILDGTAIVDRLDSVNDSIVSYPYGHASQNISTSTTTTVKTGSGVLRSIYIANPGATSNSIKVYDNTAGSGTLLLDLSTSGGLPAQGSITLDAAFATGLTVVTAGTTAPNIIVVYR